MIRTTGARARQLQVADTHAAVQDFAPGTFVDVNAQKEDRAGWLAHRANDASLPGRGRPNC